MSRLGVLWFILVIATGVTNFVVKQNVQNLDDQLTSVRRQTVAEQKKIHELTADWTFLNQPQLLTDLNNRYVHLVPVTPKQVVGSAEAIALRPAPPPPEPAPQIVEAAPAPAPTPAPPPVRAPIVQASASVPAHTPIEPAAVIAPARVQPAPAPRAPSLDGLFAQVSGDR